MKPTFIWDFDGTLVQSYGVIEEVLERLYKQYNLPFDMERVSAYIIETSVGQLLRDLSLQYDLSFEELLTFFNREQEARDDLITLMPHAKEVLDWTRVQGIQNIIYTHKGATTGQVLERLGVSSYFTEIVTSANSFKRKPDSEAVDYLIEKYQLDKNSTYYIGDRKLDVDLAQNAGILSLNIGQGTSLVNKQIENLLGVISEISIKDQKPN